MEQQSSVPEIVIFQASPTHRNERIPDPLHAGGAKGPAVEQVNSFAEGTLSEDDRGGNVLECKHLGQLVMNEDGSSDVDRETCLGS